MSGGERSMMDYEGLSVGELMEAVSAETGATPATLSQILLRERQRVHGLVANDKGEFRVLWVDTYDHEDGVVAQFGSGDEALDYVRRRTAEVEARPNYRQIRWDLSGRELVNEVGTTSRFYAYTPDGRYIDPNPKLPRINQ